MSLKCQSPALPPSSNTPDSTRPLISSRPDVDFQIEVFTEDPVNVLVLMKKKHFIETSIVLISVMLAFNHKTIIKIK